MINNRFIELLGRKMAGEATPLELEELLSITETDEGLKMIDAEMSFSTPSAMAEQEKLDAESLFASHSVSMQLNGNFGKPVAKVSEMNRRLKQVSRVAAVFMVMFSGYFAVQHYRNAANGKLMNEIVIARGNKSNITLQDGTNIMLNADSKLSYTTGFGATTREVKFAGEAYFDVAHDTSKPFIIHTGNINIRVLGTAFNVKSYPEDGVIETSLFRGRIEVTFNDRPSEKVVLKPGEKIIVKNGKAKVTGGANTQVGSKIELDKIDLAEDSTAAETAWMHDKVVFNDEAFGEIARQLERKFDVEISFLDPKIKTDTYTGSYENEPLGKILEQMSESSHFTYKIDGKKVTIDK